MEPGEEDILELHYLNGDDDSSDDYDYAVANEMGWDGTELIVHERDDEDEDGDGDGEHDELGLEDEYEDGLGHDGCAGESVDAQ
jgi:hypothetical protein